MQPVSTYLKTVIACLAFLSVTYSHAVSTRSEPKTQELSAKEIMQRVDTIEDGDTAKGKLKMILVDKKGKQKVRQFSWQRLDDAQDAKSRIVFEAPADLKGTGFIGWNWDDAEKDDDTWLCLPALKRCKRIASERQSGAFLGTDFSFYDINGLNISDWQYKVLDPSTNVDGHATWLLEAIPAEGKETKVKRKTGYRKFKIWVRKDNFLIVKGHYFVDKSEEQKYFFARGIEKIDDIWTIKQQQMITTKRGKQMHATIIQLENIAYNAPLPSQEFTSKDIELSW